MRILSLYYTDKPGGFCKRLYRILNALQARGNEVHYLSLDAPPPALSSAISFMRIPFPLQRRKGLLFWALFTWWCPIFTLCAALRIRPNKFLVFGAYYSTMVQPAKWQLGKSSILFMRSLVFKIDALTGKNAFVRFFSRLVDRFGLMSATHVVCLTKTMQKEIEHFLGRAPTSVHILPNDVPHAVSEQCSENRNLGLNPLVLLTAGVIDQRKNMDYLLDVMSKLKQRNMQEKVRLLIAGDGPLFPALKQRAEQEGLSAVEFLGWQKALPVQMRRATVLVHPSFHEGMSNTVLEALGEGMVVLAADTAEMREVLEHDALLFKPSDSESLTKIITSILENPAQLEELHRLSAARAKALTFDWDERAAELVKNLS